MARNTDGAKKGAKAAAAAAARAEASGGRFAWLLGFGLAVLPVGAATVALLMQAPPAPLHETAAPAGPEEAAPPPLHYIDLPEPLSVAVTPKGPRVQVTLAVAVRGELLKLAPLQDAVAAKGNVVLAAMLLEAQEMVRAGADSAALHRDLPERLRGVINGALGTEDWPQPVEEVLITSLFVQG